MDNEAKINELNEKLKGKDFEKLVKPRLENSKVKWRVTMVDDKPMVVFDDFEPHRLSFHLKDGLVAKVYLGG